MASRCATLLPDGRVLVAGGAHCWNYTRLSPQATSLLYEPETRTWSPPGTSRLH